MNSKQLSELLERHAHNMPFGTGMAIIKEWNEMRNELHKAEYIILVASQILGFDSSFNPKRDLGDLTDEQKHVLGLMGHIHASVACGIPGIEANLDEMRKKFPLDKSSVENMTKLLNNIRYTRATVMDFNDLPF